VSERVKDILWFPVNVLQFLWMCFFTAALFPPVMLTFLFTGNAETAWSTGRAFWAPLNLFFGFSTLVVDDGENLAQGAHLGPREIVAEQRQHLRIADGFSGPCRGDEDRADLRRIREQPGPVAHPSGCLATGVSSNTSSFDVLCGQGITSRQRNGAIRSSTPAMSRLGSSP
jgi:hypothetical protein